jgi:tRNA modification GTPase
VSPADARDTIAAVATPSGSGGVGIVRVSGPAAADVLARVTGHDDAVFEDRRMVLATACDPETGEALDQVLAVLMRAPRSYTGEDVAELHGHGGALNMTRLLRATCAAGARLAEPGEFTRRAFENGRLDLIQVEAVAAVIGAESDRALRAAQAQLQGVLGARVAMLRERVVAAAADVEAAIDFPEEGLALPESDAMRARIEAELAEIRALAGSYGAGRALREGIVVALVGAPNVGKSSLLNALVGEERALVHEEPGTTRDYVEARLVWDGVAVTLVDTAGERATTSEVERRGVALGRERAARADVVVRVRDAARPDAGETQDGELVTWNKADLAAAPAGALAVSAKTGAGLMALRAAVLARVLGDVRDGAEGELVASERQRAMLDEAAQALSRAIVALAAKRPLELVAADLRQAAAALGRVHGEAVDEAVIAGVFSRFCIGK